MLHGNYCIFQSEIFVVTDATWIEDGTTEPSTHFYNNQSTSVDVTSAEYVKLTKSANESFIYRTRASVSFPQNTAIEFDFYQENGANTDSVFRFFDGSGTAKFNWKLGDANLNVGSWVHIKFEWANNKVTFNNNTSYQKTLDTETALFGFFSSGTSDTLRFKNFIVYPI